MKKRLTKAEEDIMLIMWRLREATVRDVMQHINPTDTPYTTVSTMIRVLERKGFVTHRAVGTTYLYYPLIQKQEYLKGFLSGIVNNYFNGSFSSLASFFAKETDLKLSELQEIMQEVEQELNTNSKKDE